MDRVKEEVIEGGCPAWMDSGVVVKLEPAWPCEEDSPNQPPAVYSTAQPVSDNTSGSLLFLKRGRVCQHCSAAFVLVSGLEVHLATVHAEPLPFPQWTEHRDRQKLEPAWSMEEESLDQPTAVYSPVHVEKPCIVLPGTTTPDRYDASTSINKKRDSNSDRKTTKKKSNDNDTDDEKKRKKQHFHGTSFHNKLNHTGIKLLVCDVCSKSFTRADNLKRHKIVHTGERPFKCPHCDIDFKRACILQSHIQSVHEGRGRPHVCDVCGADFSLMGNLTKHKRIHTGEKPYVCSDCGKGFTDSSNLAHHRQTHIGEKPHICLYCPAAFRSVQYLKRHVEEIHQ